MTTQCAFSAPNNLLSYQETSCSMPIVSGRSIGPFNIGMDIGEALVIASRYEETPAIISNTDDPFNCDTLLDIPTLGFRLCFLGYSQKLHVIIVRVGLEECSRGFYCAPESNSYTNAKATVASYVSSSPQSLALSSLLNFSFNNEVLIRSSQPPPNLRHVYRVCGPTFPGRYVKVPSTSMSPSLPLNDTPSTCYYYLKYPGIEFRFPIPEDDFEVLRTLDDDEALPFTLPVSSKNLVDQSEPILSEILLYSPDHPMHDANLPSWHHAESGFSTSLQKSVFKTRMIHNEVKVTLRQGIQLPYGGTIQFGMGLQDVYQEIGPPDCVTMKDLDVVRVMLGSAAVRNSLCGKQAHCAPETVYQMGLVPEFSDGGPPTTDYFCNYFRQGFDIMFCGISHRVKKIVLQSNLPGHARFGDYVRSFFSICIEGNNKENFIKVDSTWDDIQRMMGPTAPPLLVATDKTGHIDTKQGISKEQVRKFYGYPGMAIEIFNKQWIASVTLF